MIARLPRVRVPNTRWGAFLLAGGLGLLGALIGVALLVVVPMARAGQGPFAFLFRGPKQIVDLRTRQVQQQVTGLNPARPESWQTPIATLSFPSAAAVNRVRGLDGTATVTYVPARGQRVLPLPTILDAIGRPVVSPMVALGSDQDAATPEPLRPEVTDPTQLTLAASVANSAELAGCVLAMRGPGLQAVGAFGSGSVDECQAGRLRLPNARNLEFGVNFEELPNYQSRDGAWHEGGAIGRAEITVAITAVTQG